MSIILSYNGSMLGSNNGDMLGGSWVDPYNPLGLPPHTIRCQFSEGYTPSIANTTAVQVSSSNPNLWDITTNSTTDWSGLFRENTELLGVRGANATGITNIEDMFRNCPKLQTVVGPMDLRSVTSLDRVFMQSMALAMTPSGWDVSGITSMSATFQNCLGLWRITDNFCNTPNVTDYSYCYAATRDLRTVPLIDTSAATNLDSMFWWSMGLTAVPLLNTSSATNVNYMFEQCYVVESGALALYQQMSSQANPPASHEGTFHDCGADTTSGSRELAQIPSDWKTRTYQQG